MFEEFFRNLEIPKPNTKYQNSKIQLEINWKEKSQDILRTFKPENPQEMMDLRGDSTIASLICSGVTLWTVLTQHTTQVRCQSPSVEVLFRLFRRRILILNYSITGAQ